MPRSLMSIIFTNFSNMITAKKVGCCLAIIALSTEINAQKPDYSVVSVPEETGNEFVKITKESDYVCMPIVKRSSTGVSWFTNRVIGVSPDGTELAYISTRNNSANIFIKDISKQGASRQRTNRQAVVDFSYSPDGKQICFSENKGKTTQLFITDARTGYVCRQITSGSQDYSPIFNSAMTQIFFTRSEQKGVSVWGYDVKNNFLASYTVGMNPVPIKGVNALFVARQGEKGRGELWEINYDTGTEECILSDSEHSFYTPQLSKDGRWLLFTGSSKLVSGNIVYWNTDIYACRADGTELVQLTHHAADDLSPVWSVDGRYIYFISQRGDAQGTANIWRMTFNY